MTRARGDQAASTDSTLPERLARVFFPYDSLTFESVVAHGGAAPILFRQLTNRAAGSATNFIDASIVPVGADIGIHTHTHDNEEIYIVLAGRGLMHVDGQEFEVTTGDVIVNRPGGTHGLINTGDTDLRLIVIEVPVPPGGQGTAVPGRQIRKLQAGWQAEVTATLHENPWFSVLQQAVTRPTGQTETYYTVRFPSPAVGVVARRGDEFLLIRQYRFIVDQWVWAIPSGGISEGESAAAAAMRELEEETGYAATKVVPIMHYFPSYGSGDQQFQLFLADEVTKTGGDFDRSEVHDVRWFSRAEVMDLIRQNGIVDGLSLTPLLLVLLDENARRHGEQPYLPSDKS